MKHATRLSLLAAAIALWLFIGSRAPSPAVSSATAPTQSLPTTTVAPTPRPTPAPTRTPRPGQIEWRGDLHMHTVCSDGAATYDEMIQSALDHQLDFVAITDHEAPSERTVTAHGETIDCGKVLKQCREETRLLCFPGAEVSGRLHVVAVGIETRVDSHAPLELQVAEIHRQGGLAIAAHPYDARWKYKRTDLLDSGFDAMECARGSEEENAEQWELAASYHLPCVYNSDAHYKPDVGWTSNTCRVPIESISDLKAALNAGKCGRTR